MVEKAKPQARPARPAGTTPAVPDDGIPAGDSPPKPAWPLILAFVAWGGWLIFLIAMAVYRLSRS